MSGIGVIDKIKSLFIKSKSDFHAYEIQADEVYVHGVDTPYGKKLIISNEEKSSLVEILTPQETDIFLLLLEGFNIKETARQLGTRYSTANTCQMAICRKLHVYSCAELIINYRDIGKVKKN